MIDKILNIIDKVYRLTTILVNIAITVKIFTVLFF